MRIYEELFIIQPAATEEEIDALITQVSGVITTEGGIIDKVDKWGVRRLAYRVGKQAEGFYVLIQFQAGSQTVREVERRLRVADSVLKYLTVRIDEKLKWLEKRKKAREKRAARRPPPSVAIPVQPLSAGPSAPAAPAVPAAPAAAPAPAAPAEPAGPVPGAPAVEVAE